MVLVHIWLQPFWEPSVEPSAEPSMDSLAHSSISVERYNPALIYVFMCVCIYVSQSNVVYLYVWMIQVYINCRAIPMDCFERTNDLHTHMNICMFNYVHTYICMYLCMYVWMYVCMYVCMYVSVYVCMYVCMFLYI